nr:Dihydrofolate reductase [uncultured bacterium]
MSRVAFVVAVSRNGVIGRDGGLPWHISTDLKRFKAITMGKPVIMGRKTWESLPKKPLPGRPNIVITRQKNYRAAGAIVVGDIPSALTAAGQVEEVCVIGGGEIFDMFLPQTDRIYLTEVDLEVDGDTFFPPLDPAQWTETAREIHPRGSNDSAGFVLRVLDRNA